LNGEADRAEVIAALECVNFVVIFSEVRATALLEKVRPAIYVKGGDYTTATLDGEERAVLERVGAEIRILPFESGYSTSRLVEKIRALP
jgi:bifunctional ADP-heptose synthase (sugar kinase/adenylyltransferase)